MKPLILLLWLAVILNLSAIAQPGFSTGAIVVPFSSYAGNPHNFESPYRYSTGVALGVVAQFDFTTKWSLASGVWYESASVKAGDGIFSAAYRSKQNRIVIPFLLNFRSSERKVSPYFSAGTLLVTKGNERGLAAKPLLAAGLSYRVVPHFTLNLQPSFTLGANSKADRSYYPTNRQLSFQAQLLYHLMTKTK